MSEDPILAKLHELILEHEDSQWDSDRGGCSAAHLEVELRELLAEVAIATCVRIHEEEFGSCDQVMRDFYRKWETERFGVPSAGEKT